MTPQRPKNDAAFYRLVHHLVRQWESGSPEDRREGERQLFSLVQWIAPGQCLRRPPWSSFAEVLCHDLAPRGFSFLLPRPPTFDRLVAAFGRPSELIYLDSKILYWHEVLVLASGEILRPGDPAIREQSSESSQPPTRQFLVGCRFLKRMDE